MPASPQEIAAVVASLRKAAAANLQAAGRKGAVVEIGPEIADDVLVSADLHGHRDNFAAILSAADLPRYPRRHLVMQEVCHGGPHYLQGGCMSHRMLEEIAELQNAYPGRVHFLLSNHELSELTDFPIVKGQRLLNLSFRCGMLEAYGLAADEVRQGYVEFLRSLPLAIRLPGGIFISHSLPENVHERGFDAGIFQRPATPEDWQPQGAIFRLVWGRDFRPENARAFAALVGARTLIHGHEPCPDGYQIPNDVQIILDCSGRPASYLLIPTNRDWSHAELTERIHSLS